MSPSDKREKRMMMLRNPRRSLKLFGGIASPVALAARGSRRDTSRAADSQSIASSPVPLYRLHCPEARDHLYITSVAERNHAITYLGYSNEEIVACIWPTADAMLVPLYRMYSFEARDHLYTTSVAERNRAITYLGYSDEGVAGYVSAHQVPNLIPFYRLFHGRNIDHLYTTEVVESNHAIMYLGYCDEGIAAWVLPYQRSATVGS
jgi:hypothetical protein